jgi:hypothetical protein
MNFKFQGKLAVPNGTISVSGEYAIGPHGGVMGWSGQIRDDSGAPLFATGGPFTLTLLDGRKGMILLDLSSISSSGSSATHFTGTGPPPS